MMEAIVAAVLLLAALAALLLGKRYAASQAPVDYRMADAWEHVLSTAHALPSEQLSTLGQAIKKLPAATMEQVRQELLCVEQQVLASSDPLRALRSAIMDAASRSLYAAHILLLTEKDRQRLVTSFGASYADEEMLSTLVAQELAYTVLRDWARYRFDDAGEKDWFDAYLSVARRLMQARAPGAAAGKALREDTISGMYQVEYLMLLERLKEKLLNAPSKTPLDDARMAEQIRSSPS